MKVLCNNRPTVVNLTIGYETVMSVKGVQTALFVFFFIAFLHFPSTIRQLPCIIDIGAHKPRLLVPFAMCNCNEFLCQMITARMNSCVYDLLYLSYMYYMAIKTYLLSLSLSRSWFTICRCLFNGCNVAKTSCTTGHLTFLKRGQLAGCWWTNWCLSTRGHQQRAGWPGAHGVKIRLYR